MKNSVFSIANPASEYCTDKGYDLVIETDSDGGQNGYCVFPNGTRCMEWDYYCKCSGNSSFCSPSMIEQASVCTYPCNCDPVNGGWTSWSECKSDCTQSRSCTDPVPSCGGSYCVGEKIKECSGGKCLVENDNDTDTDPDDINLGIENNNYVSTSSPINNNFSILILILVIIALVLIDIAFLLFMYFKNKK